MIADRRHRAANNEIEGTNSMPLRTRLTEKLGISHPILLVPMGTASGGTLAKAPASLSFSNDFEIGSNRCRPSSPDEVEMEVLVILRPADPISSCKGDSTWRATYV
jgi:hypothetical protein